MPWLYKPKHSRFWRIGDYLVAGGPVRSWSTKCEKEADAKKKLATYESMKSLQAADRLNDQMYQALTGKQLPNVSLKKAGEQWLLECKGSTEPGTYRTYERVIRFLCEHLQASDDYPLLKSVSTSNLFDYLTDRRNELSASTVNLERTVLSIFFLRCIKQRLITDNPMEGVKAFKAKEGEGVERRVYTIEELKNIYDTAPNDFWRYMILGGFYTALRMGDLITLQVSSVNIKANTLTRRNKKTGKMVHVPLAVPLRDAIIPLLKGRKAKDYLWPKQAAIYIKRGAAPFSREYRALILEPLDLAPKLLHWRQRKKLKVKPPQQQSDIVFHSLRHTMNTHLQMEGVHKSVAQALLGHSNERVNSGYTHVDEPAMREAIGKLPRFNTN